MLDFSKFTNNATCKSAALSLFLAFVMAGNHAFSQDMTSTQSLSGNAATIAFIETARPGNLPAEFVESDKNKAKFFTITAIDGNRVDAALWTPKQSQPGVGTIVVSVHGSGGDYSYNPVGFLSRGLAENGYSVLAINTRQSGDRVNTDNFFDVRRDIEAAVYTARRLGYKSIVLHGHSLGNIQVQFYAATSWDPDIRAVVLTGMFADLPSKSRSILVQNEVNYGELSRASFEAVKGGNLADILPIQMFWISGQKAPLTAQHFLTYRWEATSTASGIYWIKRVPKPILMVRDEADAIIHDFEPYMLLAAATAPGTLVPRINFELLRNPKPRNPAAHGFVDNKTPLVETVTRWIRDLGL